MDLPPKVKPEPGKKQSFSSLKLLEVDLDDKLGYQPFGAEHGKLDNGLTYYVRCNSKPQNRAALFLVVKVGSVMEEEFERGVAHIVEHLAFSATKSYTNHDIIKFLESIGADFGPCGNAYTSSDETVYDLLIPIDKPEILPKAISILAEYSTEIRISPDDLEKERGAVLEEYRECANASDRLFNAKWERILEGSKYAERLPIGLENVIRTVTADVARGFYTKWYNLHNMAVVAVGDFSSTQIVIDLIKEHFGQINYALDFPRIPWIDVPLHEEPRFSCSVDSEASESGILISWKMKRRNTITIRDFKDWLIQCIFCRAMNQRCYKISHEKDPPYFSCYSSEDFLVNPIEGIQISASCREKEVLKALESILMELARVRLHGFSESEISVARAFQLSCMEAEYAERHKTQSSTLCRKYIEHFLRDEIMVGVEYEAQLQKTILPKILASDVSKYAEKFRTSCSCVVIISEPHATVTEDDLKTTVTKICSLEKEKEVSPWGYDDCIPEDIVCVKPNPGNIVKQSEYPDIGTTELILSNGLKVCYKCTDFNDNQIIFQGFSYGGYSELGENDYLSCIKGSSIAQQIGKFGHEPSVLIDMLAGKRATVYTSLESYTRSFSGSCSPSDFETALQLVYQLFLTEVEHREEHVKIVKQKTEYNIRANERDPYTAFCNRVRQLLYGDSHFYKPFKVKDIGRFDPVKACEYFNNCFKDPSTFILLIVGNLDPASSLPLMLEYLGGIPKPSKPIEFYRDNLKDLPRNPSYRKPSYREVVRSTMVEVQCSVHISFPIELKRETQREESYFVYFVTRLLEMKLMQVLRFNHGKIYGVYVTSYYNGNLRGEISVDFSCDPDSSSALVDIALNEILRLQEHGPTEEDLSSILEIEQRARENGLQVNYYWLSLLSSAYCSSFYNGDVSSSFQAYDKARTTVRQALTPLTAKWALQTVLPYPCKDHYTSVILLPQMPLFHPLKYLPQCIKSTFDRQEKVVAVIAGLAIFTMSVWRSLRKG